MADNYLEKQMDDYRSGKLGSRRHGPQRGAGKATLSLRVRDFRFSDGAMTPAATALMSALTAAGHRVLFTADDSTAATRIAQLTGALFIPLDEHTADNISRLRPAGLDYLIDFGVNMLTLTDARTQQPTGRIRFTASTRPELIARAVMLMADEDVTDATVSLR